MADFAVSVAKWVDKAKQRGTMVFRGIAFEAVGRVQELTPVKTGFLRANWVDTPSEDAVPKPAPSQQIGMAIAQAKLGDTIYVLNPVQYARRIEYGFVGKDSNGREYNQRGRGMVQQTVAEIPQIAEQVVRDLG